MKEAGGAATQEGEMEGEKKYERNRIQLISPAKTDRTAPPTYVMPSL